MVMITEGLFLSFAELRSAVGERTADKLAVSILQARRMLPSSLLAFLGTVYHKLSRRTELCESAMITNKL